MQHGLLYCVLFASLSCGAASAVATPTLGAFTRECAGPISIPGDPLPAYLVFSPPSTGEASVDASGRIELQHNARAYLSRDCTRAPASYVAWSLIGRGGGGRRGRRQEEEEEEEAKGRGRDGTGNLDCERDLGLSVRWPRPLQKQVTFCRIMKTCIPSIYVATCHGSTTRTRDTLDAVGSPQSRGSLWRCVLA